MRQAVPTGKKDLAALLRRVAECNIPDIGEEIPKVVEPFSEEFFAIWKPHIPIVPTEDNPPPQPPQTARKPSAKARPKPKPKARPVPTDWKSIPDPPSWKNSRFYQSDNSDDEEEYNPRK